MVFRNIEDCVLEKDRVTSYTRILNDTPKPTQIVLPLTLDIAAYLQKQGLGDDYVLFGGYSVLSHLMQEGGEHMAISWRGSDDIDIAATEEVIRTLKNEYHIISDKASPNLANKRTLKVFLPGEDISKNECKIDVYTGSFEERFFPCEINNHFGCDLRVSNPLSIIRSKLYTSQREMVHSEDITRLIYVLENREHSPKNTARFFNSEQKALLLTRFRAGYDNICSNGLDADLVPSEDYKKQFEKELGRGKRVK